MYPLLRSKETRLLSLTMASFGLQALSQSSGKSSFLALPAHNVSSFNVSAPDIAVECDGRRYGRPVRISAPLIVPFILGIARSARRVMKIIQSRSCLTAQRLPDGGKTDSVTVNRSPLVALTPGSLFRVLTGKYLLRTVHKRLPATSCFLGGFHHVRDGRDRRVFII